MEPKRDVPKKKRSKGLLASQVSELARKYESMEKTGEPFGTIVIAEKGQKLASQGRDIIFCAESIISTRVPDEVLDETANTFRQSAVGQEAPFLGIPELRQLIASRFERLYGQKVNWENEVIITSGSMQSEYYLMAALLNPGDEVIIPTPTFFFDIPVHLARGKSVFYRLNPKKNYFHEKASIAKLITRKTKMITLCNPHNPTGRALTEDEISGIAELARKHDLLIMHDQVYERMVYDGRPYVPMCKYSEVRDRLISISSFSKLFNMINYRLGYSIAPKEIIRGMELVHGFSSMGIPSLVQRGAVAALDPNYEERHLSETIAKLQKARDYAVEKLGSVEGITIAKPEGTNLILPNISAFGMSSMAFCNYLLEEAGVACAPGVAYHAEGHVRISLGTERIEEAIDRIVGAVSKLEPKMSARSVKRK